jgi:hypothetical protein
VLRERWRAVLDLADDPQLTEAVVWAMVPPFLSLAVSVRMGELPAESAERIWNGLMAGAFTVLNPVE